MLVANRLGAVEILGGGIEIGFEVDPHRQNLDQVGVGTKEIRAAGIDRAARHDSPHLAIGEPLKRPKHQRAELLNDDIALISHHQRLTRPSRENREDHGRVGNLEVENVRLDVPQRLDQLGAKVELQRRANAAEPRDLDRPVFLDDRRARLMIDAEHPDVRSQRGLRAGERSDVRLNSTGSRRIIFAKMTDVKFFHDFKARGPEASS